MSSHSHTVALTKSNVDIIGDVHGCFDELVLLLERLGYKVDVEGFSISHPENRTLVFVGDLVDRGPKSPKVLKLVMAAQDQGVAFCITGNHDDKLRRLLLGNDVIVADDLKATLDQLNAESDELKEHVLAFLNTLPSYLVLDHGNLIVTHAAIKPHYVGQMNRKVRTYCMYGPTTGKTDDYGLPIRLPWAEEYAGDALVVYGHEASKELKIIGNTINIDTACVFGNKLTAFRYPEKTFESVKALKAYWPLKKPLD